MPDERAVKMLEKIFQLIEKNSSDSNELKVLIEKQSVRLEDHIESNKESKAEIVKMRERLEEYNLLLKDHMKRTELAEEGIDLLHQESEKFQEHLIQTKTTKDLWIRVSTILGALATAGAGIVAVIKYLF